MMAEGNAGSTSIGDESWQTESWPLNEHFGLSFLGELIARKVAEGALAGVLDWPFHAAWLAELEAQLDVAFEESTLPEERDRKAVHDFLIRLRLADR
jgi:hypothetical protein